MDVAMHSGIGEIVVGSTVGMMLCDCLLFVIGDRIVRGWLLPIPSAVCAGCGTDCRLVGPKTDMLSRSLFRLCVLFLRLKRVLRYVPAEGHSEVEGEGEGVVGIQVSTAILFCRWKRCLREIHGCSSAVTLAAHRLRFGCGRAKCKTDAVSE